MDEMGRLEAIWIKRAKGGPMDAAGRARAVTGKGLAGNADQGGKRQVTIISREVWDELRDVVSPLVEPIMRRANLLVSGIVLARTRGRVLRIGTVRVRVHGESRPCEQMDRAVPGLRRAMESNWRGGVFGEVLDDGELAVGDAVGWEAEGRASVD
jgi:MOSC domain-containing protein YiiM